MDCVCEDVVDEYAVVVHDGRGGGVHVVGVWG